jgi:hypothetical protein
MNVFRKWRLPKILGGAAAVAAVAAALTGSAATSPPANTSAPTISGAARDGSTLVARPGNWTGNPTSFAYRWQRCDTAGANCAPIMGATSKQYTATSSDIGYRLRVDVTATNSAGSGTATSGPTAAVIAAGSAPVNTAPPTISGTPQQDSALTAGSGTWTGTQPISISYAWLLCDSDGNNCGVIAGASASTYTAVSADVGQTIRIRVTAMNVRGSTAATSQPTDLVAPAKSGAGTTAVAVAKIALPDRLVVDNVQFSPTRIAARGPVTARFHVSDLRGFSIQGALVYALGLPYGWVANAPEVSTDGSGCATITLQPTARLPLHRAALVIFVRARKPGENLLAGVSTRRLVQVGIG